MTSNIETSNNSLNPTDKPMRKFLDFLNKNRILILSIVLIILTVVMVNLLVTKAFEPYFKCEYLIDGTLKWEKISLCEGIKFGVGPWDLPSGMVRGIRLFFKDFSGVIGPFPDPKITVLPGLQPIDIPLNEIRKFIVWTILVAFAVVSLVLAYVVNKIKIFIDRLRTPEGRRFYLTNLNFWLLFFAIFSGLFYFGVVVPSMVK